MIHEYPLAVGVGTRVPTQDAVLSLRTAQIAAHRAGVEGVVWADREPLCILLADPDVAATVGALAGSALAGLEKSLLDSATSYLRHLGSWGSAAAELGIHRHTLRHRMRQVEQVTGLRLDDAQDRLLIHLALLAKGPGR